MTKEIVSTKKSNFPYEHTSNDETMQMSHSDIRAFDRI